MSIELPKPQKEALDEAVKALRLHCDAFVLCLRASNEVGDYGVETFWEGNMPEAVGLAEIARLRMENIAQMQTDFTAFDDKEEA